MIQKFSLPVVLFSLLYSCVASATASQQYDLQISQDEARGVLNELLKDSPQSEDKILQLLNSYRAKSVNGTPSIEDAPFVGYILKNQIVDGWSDLYKAQYDKNFDLYVTHPTDVRLFDMLMGAVAANQLPNTEVKVDGKSINVKSEGDQIGACLAKRVEEVDADKCDDPTVTDNSDDNPEAPGILTLAWEKYTCFIPFITSSCKARKSIYTKVKPILADIKKANVMAEFFPQIFPPLIRSEIVDGATEKRKDIAPFVSGKFGATADQDFWNKAPLIDIQDTQNRVTGLREFAEGLSADLRSASVLSQSKDPEATRMAAALFYAAANRLLILMGGVEAKWGGDQFVSAPLLSKDPGAAPQFQTSTFGGLGVINSGTKAAPEYKMVPWDIVHYDPTASKNPSPLQLFPSRFILGADGVPSAIPGEAPYETIGDLGVLLGALTDFLELTAAQEVLAPHFAVAATSFDKIVDPANPALFPREGRQLAVGLIAAIVKNVISPNGHMVIPGSSAPSDSVDQHSGILGFRYYDVIGLNGRVDSKTPTSSIAGFFDAVQRFGKIAASGDQDIPKELVDYTATINSALELSILGMNARAQQKDGGFSDSFSESSDAARNLDDQIAAIQLMTDTYNQTREPAMGLILETSWKFLDQFWASGSAIPQPSVGGLKGEAQAQQISSLTLWRALTLWNKTVQTPVYFDLNKGVNWAVWGERFEELQKQLMGQLDTEQGPQPIQFENR
jgi:hypothetical protein